VKLDPGAGSVGTCHQCGATYTEVVRFRDTCPTCSAYLHCCLNCRLYSPSAHNHCLSSTTEPVRDVAEGNFCDEFEFVARARAEDAAKKAKSRFDQLFGD
jgi:hypothetical protein